MAIHRFFADTENARRLASRLAAGRPKDALALALGERRSGLICARPDQLARRSERDRTDDLGRMEHLDRDFGVRSDCKRARPGRFAGGGSRTGSGERRVGTGGGVEHYIWGWPDE